MSYKLCCGTLNVSQLTIPAVPTSEIDQLPSHDDSTSSGDTVSLSDDQLQCVSYCLNHGRFYTYFK